MIVRFIVHILTLIIVIDFILMLHDAGYVISANIIAYIMGLWLGILRVKYSKGVK